MPAAVVAAIIAGGASVGAATIASRSASGAAKRQTDAANHAADLEAQANREALAFQREQAARQAAIDETTRHADYDQWAAQQRRYSDIGTYLGLPAREIPGYVPLPAYGSSPTGAPTGAPTAAPTGSSAAPAAAGNYAMPSINVNDPASVDAFIKAGLSASRAPGAQVTDNDLSYWRDKVVKDPAYFWDRLLGKGAGGADAAVRGPYAGAAGSGAPLSASRSVGSYLSPQFVAAPAPTLAMPTAQRRYGSVGSYL